MTDEQTEAGTALGARERAITAVVLALIAVLAVIDVTVDLQDGVSAWHVLAEALLAAAALGGALYLVRGAWALRRRLEAQTRDFSAYRREMEAWRADARKHVEGLAREIDRQLGQWQLTDAEREVAFLLLKGLSSKEVAAVRGTSEKTVRVQSSAIYAKSGLSGRSELAAFFLEELLPPSGGEGQLPP